MTTAKFNFREFLKLFKADPQFEKFFVHDISHKPNVEIFDIAFKQGDLLLDTDVYIAIRNRKNNECFKTVLNSRNAIDKKPQGFYDDVKCIIIYKSLYFSSTTADKDYNLLMRCIDYIINAEKVDNNVDCSICFNSFDNPNKYLICDKCIKCTCYQCIFETTIASINGRNGFFCSFCNNNFKITTMKQTNIENNENCAVNIL